MRWLAPAISAMGCLALTACAGTGTRQTSADAAVVMLDKGAVRGVADTETLAWLGIPYATPPLGALRWRPPQPVAEWAGIRETDKMSANCIQGPMPGATPADPTSEDCLYLNIWRPATKARSLPVIVWIHGGAFVNGGSTSPETHGNALARRGAIVVTFNYRLGRLGFFAHPDLTAEFPDEAKGNYGLMDQIAALQWVKRNIAAFGGDPNRITLMGESAGGIAINLLLGSTATAGLFDRAIVMSGAGRDFLGGGRPLTGDAAGQLSAESLGLAFARDRGIAGRGQNAIAALRSLPAERISGDLSMVTLVVAGEKAHYAGPIRDGHIVTQTPETMFRSQRQRAMPLMVGATSADLSLDNYGSKAAAFAHFGASAEAARQAYDADGTTSLGALARAIGADRNMVEPARFVARAMASVQQPVFQYRFGYVAEYRRAQSPFGADHASDVPFAFDRLDAVTEAPAARDLNVAARFADYIIQFARTGDPNGRGLPRWPRFDRSGDRLLDIGADGSFTGRPDPWRPRLDLMESLADAR